MIFKTIVADPPWKYTKNPPARTGGGVSAEHQYQTMTTEEIAALPVAALAAADAHLYMWVTNPVMLGMRPTIMGRLSPPDVARAWGFEPKAMITWIKTARSTGEATRGGMGWYFRGATEHLIFAVRGGLPIPADKRLPNVFYAEKTKHSKKPKELFDIVEDVSPGPYLEMFAREERPGWCLWGDQAPNSIDTSNSMLFAA